MSSVLCLLQILLKWLAKICKNELLTAEDKGTAE